MTNDIAPHRVRKGEYENEALREREKMSVKKMRDDQYYIIKYKREIVN